MGFGTGGWDSDFPNSMLEILRVNLLELDDHQRFIVGGAEGVLQRLWRKPAPCAHWPEGTTLAGIENITGSAQGDSLTGDTNTNVLDAAAGDDST